MQGSKLNNCVVGCNAYVGKGCELTGTIILGNNTYTNDASREASRRKGEVVLGIGEHTSRAARANFTAWFGKESLSVLYNCEV